ncbi:Ca2+-dependent phosphoinositide-specific phospholipase C [Cyclobacterium plantarum]|uniref:Ca2+-dependent phosphoinositide-specific phospholipase C n=1 Tax=Cyclobacterium plantarum TaxID=2716263 RepID=UPI003F6FF278
MYFRLLVFAVFSIICSCGQKPTELPEPVSINHLQFIGSHNSYKKAIPQVIMDQISSENPGLAASLDYSHPGIWQQLDMGLRLLELDVYHDPEGGRFSKPLGLKMTREEIDPDFDTPGFKVFHVQDIDYRSHHPLLEDYLKELKSWSDLHPNHLPVFITLNAKDQNYPEKGLTEALPFDKQAFQALDQAIFYHLGKEKLIRPADVTGSQPDLRTAIATNGWPELEEAKGKFIWILDEKAKKQEAYLSSLEARETGVFFVTVSEDHPMAGIFILNDPVSQQAQIRDLVEKGYLVRTRADSDTQEARTNDTQRRDKAFESGAQLISTDYYIPDQRWDSRYQVVFEKSSYTRINPFNTGKNLENFTFDEENEGVIGLDPQTFSLAEAQIHPLVLDVRTQAEVDEGIITGASHIDFLQEGFQQKIEELDLNKERPVLVYCKVGGRSAKAAEQLMDAGFKNVYHLEGGIDLWKSEGFPVVP